MPDYRPKIEIAWVIHRTHGDLLHLRYAGRPPFSILCARSLDKNIKSASHFSREYVESLGLCEICRQRLIRMAQEFDIYLKGKHTTIQAVLFSKDS